MKQAKKVQNPSQADLESLFSSEIILRLAKISDYTQQLLPEEHQLISTAVDKRRREFSTGRYCAHRALEQMGFKTMPLLAGSKREPLWPEGVKGSISHSDEYGVAVIGRDQNLISIGIDIEVAKPISTSVRNLICNEDEIESLGSRSDDPIVWKLIFSAKESIYKCLYPVLHQWIGFSDVQLLFDFESGAYTAMMNKSLNIPESYIEGLSGQFIIEDRYLFTCCELLSKS